MRLNKYLPCILIVSAIMLAFWLVWRGGWLLGAERLQSRPARREQLAQRLLVQTALACAERHRIVSPGRQRGQEILPQAQGALTGPPRSSQ